MTNIYELGSSLEKLLSTLKKNRDNVPLDVLKTYYKEPYSKLISQINETATAFVKAVIGNQLIINPNLSVDEQYDVINQTIEKSGTITQMRSCLSKTYSIEQLHQLALNLRKEIEDALWPYIDQETCLLADWMDIEKEPVIYNTLTRKTYVDGAWIDQDIDFKGKFLIYIKPDKNEKTGQTPAEKENDLCA